MKRFEYTKEHADLFKPDVINLVSRIHENKGKQDLYIQTQTETLKSLGAIAKVQSTDASNRIEGIYTSNARLKALVEEKTEPSNRNEEEIAGYRDVLNLIHENHDYIELTPNHILQLHKMLYTYHPSDAGEFKNMDNVVQEKYSDGSTRVRFVPLSAFETPEAMQRLCDAYKEAIQAGQIDPLLLIAQFVLDFLCIHPFRDGNGRLSRLLTLLLLYQQGYIVGKYVSIELITEKTKSNYYDTLEKSSAGWMEDQFSYAPFVRYQLGVILAAYKELTYRVETVLTSGLNKTGRIKDLFNKTPGKISKSEIANTNPDISTAMIEKVLGNLVKEGQIEKVGKGPATAYVKVHEQVK